jgi:hypothetical protein
MCYLVTLLSDTLGSGNVETVDELRGRVIRAAESVSDEMFDSARLETASALLLLMPILEYIVRIRSSVRCSV